MKFEEIKALSLNRRSKLSWITPTEVMEYLFCKRFIYFMNVLNIDQKEELREKVLIGRHIHEKKSKENVNYLRKKQNVKHKMTNVYLASKTFGIRGVIDEVLFKEDGTASPFDYKFAEYKQRLFRTLRIQSVIYAMLIMENFYIEVAEGYVCFIRSKNKVISIDYKFSDFEKVVDILNDMFKIIEVSYYPRVNRSSNKCIDCTYRNVCV